MTLLNRRVFIFGIGFLLGCVLVGLIHQRRQEDRAELENLPKALPHWMGKQLYFHEDPSSPDKPFYRIRIIEDSGYKRAIRLQETLIDIPNKLPHRVIARTVMEVDLCTLTIAPGTEPEIVKSWISSLGYTLVTGKEDNTYVVRIPYTAGTDPLPPALEALRSGPAWVLQAEPVVLVKQ